MLIEIINFITLLFSFFLLAFLYILSLQPMKKIEKYGDKAWKYCKNLRAISIIFELISIVNLILWNWYPLPIIGEWIIYSNIWVGITIALIFFIPCIIIMTKGMLDAGTESISPSKDTDMYGGIYNYIRHPQALGEFPIYILIGFAFNSWFLVIISTIFIVIYTPIMIYYEEQDLLRRFGDKYLKYQKRTGALFPKRRKKKK